MSLTAWFVVILVTSAAVLLGTGWLLERGNRQLERIRLLDQLDQATANVQLPRAGRLELDYPPPGSPLWDWQFFGGGQTFQGASLTGQPVPWDLAGAAYALGQQRAGQDEVSREVDAIMLELELNPKRWRRDG